MTTSHLISIAGIAMSLLAGSGHHEGSAKARAEEPQRTDASGNYATVNGLRMYYEVHGSGDPVVLLHGAFMTITNNWTGWLGELSKTRKVIAIEMQGHGRTADNARDITDENLADDVAALLEQLKIPRADLIGYSMGGAVAMQCAIRHPDKVRKVVIISSYFRRDGVVKEALDAIPKLTADDFKGSPIEAEYKKLSPTPDEFPNFVKRLLATASRAHDISADQLKATTANAACAAALAGCGQPKDEPPPDDVARTRLRGQALDWLKAELSAWDRVASATGPGNKELVATTLNHSKGDGDLAGIRDEKELARLPESQRAGFKALWDDVDRLLARVTASND